MKSRIVDRTFIQSKLARRIFLLFIACAMIPLLITTILTYRQEIAHLNRLGYQRLAQTTKSVSMAIFERLLFLEAEMSLVGIRYREQGNDFSMVGLFETEIVRFNAIAVLRPTRGWEPIWRRMSHDPSFTFDELQNIKNGDTIIINRLKTDGPPQIYMAMAVDPHDAHAGILAGEISPAYLWGIGHLNTLPPATELCVLNPSGSILVSSLNAPYALLDKVSKNLSDADKGRLSWQYQNETYLADWRKLFLKSRFAVPEWTVILSQAESDVLESVAHFNRIFPLVMALTFLVVLQLSFVAIRKSLVPLVELKRGTRQVAAGDFNTRVSIQSNDEFEDLAQSFNKMAEDLGRRFNELAMLADVGQRTATISDVTVLSREILKNIIHHLDYERGILLLVDAETGSLRFQTARGFSQDHIGWIKYHCREEMTQKDRSLIYKAVKTRSPQFHTANDDDGGRFDFGLLGFIEEVQGISVVCIPIVYEHRVLGVFILDATVPLEGRGAGDDRLLMGLAYHTAVSLTNAFSFEKLQESEERFRKIFDYAGSGMALVSPDGWITRVNNQLVRSLGYTADEIMRKPLYELSESNDASPLLDALARLMADEIAFDLFEHRFVHKDGKRIWTLVSVSLLRNRQGRPLHFILLVQDITRIKEADQERERLESQLHQAQKMEAIGALAGGVAHDFNNILSAIMGYTQLGMMDTSEHPKLYERFEGIFTASQRAADLTGQILAFSRQSKIEAQPIKSGIIIKEALKLLRASLPSNIEIRSHISNAPDMILADPTQLHQIVMNLCTNAHHAMAEHGGVLEVTLAPCSPENGNGIPHDLPPGTYIKLSISDTGCGMDTETLNRIFEPYYTTKERGKGTGLGLSVVHGIVRSYRGGIAVRSQTGKGTTFDVYFPTVSKDGTVNAERSHHTPTGTERILFIEDEKDIRKIARSILEKLGYEIVIQSDPREALSLFASQPERFDLVITDMTMPKMTGDKLALEIMQTRRDIPIILCTGNQQIVSKEKAEAVGFRRVLYKPLNIVDMACAIREVLDGAQRQPIL